MAHRFGGVIAANRPITLIRCPQGRAKKCFFQKHDTGSMGEDVKHVPIEEKKGGVQDYLYVDDIKGILSCVQMGTIEFHGWGSRSADVEAPEGRRPIFQGKGSKSPLDISPDGEKILSTAAPAGPAFEGGAIRCGRCPHDRVLRRPRDGSTLALAGLRHPAATSATTSAAGTRLPMANSACGSISIRW